jgi:hypothetical protein
MPTAGACRGAAMTTELKAGKSDQACAFKSSMSTPQWGCAGHLCVVGRVVL